MKKSDNTKGLEVLTSLISFQVKKNYYGKPFVLLGLYETPHQPFGIECHGIELEITKEQYNILHKLQKPTCVDGLNEITIK